MSLPLHFEGYEEYIEESVSFFREYQYLYNFANTDILVYNVLDNIQVKNLDELDILAKDFDITTEINKNDFLNNFFTKLERLEVVYDVFVEDSQLDNKINVPLSSKKRHEIAHLAKEIANICEESGCDTVVDFGSGLGYLDQLLYAITNFKVLGLECNDTHYVGAKKRQRKYHEDSLQNVKYIKHTVNEESSAKIEQYLEDKFNKKDFFCISGLHACADLTIDAIHLFLKMSDAKALVLMPCCYHKMRINGGMFKNFPLSNTLKVTYEKYEGWEYMKIPFLRLAAQPRQCGEDLGELVFNLLARAVLELYAKTYNYKLKRNKRKAVKMKSTRIDFESYIQDASTHGFKLSKNEPSTYSNKDNICDDKSSKSSIEFDLDNLRSIWRKISEDSTFKKAAIFILLQNHLQPVIENFVLFDRLIYLKENGVNNSRLKKIFNEKISPRCVALLACK